RVSEDSRSSRSCAAGSHRRSGALATRESVRVIDVAPTGILFGHLHDQRLQLRFDSRSAGVTTVFRAIALLGNQFPVPSQNRVRLGHAGHLGQSLAPNSLADFGQGGPLWIG